MDKKLKFYTLYCLSKKSWPILYGKLLYEMGQEFLEYSMYSYGRVEKGCGLGEGGSKIPREWKLVILFMILKIFAWGVERVPRNPPCIRHATV